MLQMVRLGIIFLKMARRRAHRLVVGVPAELVSEFRLGAPA